MRHPVLWLVVVAAAPILQRTIWIQEAVVKQKGRKRKKGIMSLPSLTLWSWLSRISSLSCLAPCVVSCCIEQGKRNKKEKKTNLLWLCAWFICNICSPEWHISLPAPPPHLCVTPPTSTPPSPGPHYFFPFPFVSSSFCPFISALIWPVTLIGH